MQSIPVQEAQKKQHKDEIIILDVRTPEEYASGHIPDSKHININSDDFEKNINLLDKNASYAVHCRAGGRARRAARYMRENGFRDVSNLEGGFIEWKAQNLPIEKNIL